MANKLWNNIRKLFNLKKYSIEEGRFERFFNKVFIPNKNEKQNIISLLNKADVNDLLFYTDVRNVPFILNEGIKVLNNIKPKENEEYYVWTYFQKDDSTNLEFGNSTRAYFWKWANSTEMDYKKIAVVGINPKHLMNVTKKDWLLDRAQGLVNISEDIFPQTFSWIMVQDIQYYKKVESIKVSNDLTLDVYYGDEGVVRAKQKIVQKQEYEKQGE